MTRFDGTVAPLAVATRSGFDESVHHGAGVALGTDGTMRASIGDPHLVVYPRSCLKPLQAHAMIGLGLDLPDDLLAVACASHDGSAVHLDAVLAILDRFGLAESDLDNTPDEPLGDPERAASRAAGIGPTPLQQNCSGKHAAMLATCRIRGWPTAGYLEFDHPLQLAITRGIEALGATVHHVGVDGCGAPTHAISLVDLARAYATLAAPGSVIARAMSSHPEMTAGPTHHTALWMRAIPTLIAKDGAAGMMAAAVADGRALAFKVADGSPAARQAVVPEALRAAGVDVDVEAPDTVGRVAVPVLGHGRPVGRLRAVEWTPCSS